MHTRSSTRILGFALASLAVVPALAAAQSAPEPTGFDPSNTRGFFLNVRSGGYGVGFEGDRDGTGGGFGVRMGYGISDRTTLFAGAEGGNISRGDGFQGLRQGDDYGLLYLDLGARFHFRMDTRLVPFLEASVNVLGVWFDNELNQDATYGGAGATLGGGLLYFVTPQVALEGAALLGGGSLMTSDIGGVERDESIGLAGVRIQVGVSVYPNR